MIHTVNIVIDKDGKLFFDNYFDEDDLDVIKDFLKEKLNIEAEVERNNERPFKNVPALWKKRNIRDIDWSDPENIMILLRHEDKTNNEILKLLGVPDRESSFVIVTRMRSVRQKFKMWAKDSGIDDNLEEHIEKFAKLYASQQKKTNKKIFNAIKKMDRDGCKILGDEEDMFPECKEGFSLECVKCPFNKGHINDSTDVDRFNEVLEKRFPYED